MKVVKKKVEADSVLLDVTASTAEVSEILNNAGIQFCTRMGVQPNGNKTPAQAASEQLGIKDLDAVVNSQAIEMFIPKALDKYGKSPAFTPMAEPKTPLRRGRTFQFEMKFVEKPKLELSSYDPISITVDPYIPDDSAVDLQIAKMAENYSEFAEAEAHPLGKGDSCKLFIRAFKNGEELTGLNTDGRSYSVGEGLMPEGFDEGIIGMNVGEERMFSFEGPSFDADFNQIMETIDCTVRLLEIQKRVAPVINDEWVKSHLPMYTSLQNLRDELSKGIEQQRKWQYDDYVRNKAAEEIGKRLEGHISDEIYEGTMREVNQGIHRQVEASGQTWQEFVDSQGGEQQITMLLMMQTRVQLSEGFALDAVYRHEGLTYTDTEIDEVCRTMDPRNPRAVRSNMERNGMGFMLREAAERLAASKYLVKNADITVRDKLVDLVMQ